MLLRTSTSATKRLCRRVLGRRLLSSESTDVRLDLPSGNNGVATITLDSPKTRNALSLDILNQLKTAIAEVEEHVKTSVVIIQANSKDTGVFCSGHNLKEVIQTRKDRDAQQLLFRTCSELMSSITHSPKAVICKVDGLATAAGCQLVASCDLAVASDRSTFGTPGVNIGLFCSTPAVPIVRAVGQKRALQMLLTGDLVDAETAERWGLISFSVGEGEIDAAVDTLAQKVALKSSTAIAMGKAGFYDQLSDDLDQAYLKASDVMVENMMEYDAGEGISAFLEKRAPVWSTAER